MVCDIKLNKLPEEVCLVGYHIPFVNVMQRREIEEVSHYQYAS